MNIWHDMQSDKAKCFFSDTNKIMGVHNFNLAPRFPHMRDLKLQILYFWGQVCRRKKFL